MSLNKWFLKRISQNFSKFTVKDCIQLCVVIGNKSHLAEHNNSMNHVLGLSLQMFVALVTFFNMTILKRANEFYEKVEVSFRTEQFDPNQTTTHISAKVI